MRLSLAGLLALASSSLPTGAMAAMQINCVWEGKTPVAITVEGDVGMWREYDHGAYYTIEANKLGVWLLLDEPRPVLDIKLTRPTPPIGVVLIPQSNGGRCWK